jgi:uncharacterized membrane protein
MTPAEIDAEIQNLRGQVLQLQQQQDAPKKYWFRCGLIAMSISTALQIMNFAGPNPQHDIILFAAMQFIFLGGVFVQAGRRPTDTYWSGLKWAFSSDKHHPTASRPGA